ncbi:MAG: 50S ribosome-binding GTPase [Candidatus Marsarchaeota archaeon]|nr:50S ribosome-binding GTPase [Candidatus Marsarchaeota archaeon]MCL5106108.1 50S ribosome-binding GTPase [Candidatus Marsarchaeota archaeon]
MGQKDYLTGKLEELKQEYKKTKYNKATNKHLSILRAKISGIKKEIIESNKKIKGTGFFVKKHGDATVGLVGFPSVGKSSLINLITNVISKTAHYAFTTTRIIQGVLNFNNAKIQIIDTPGLIEGAHLGVGNGRAVIAALKIVDLIAFVVDVCNISSLDILITELRGLDIYINKKKPDLKIIKTDSNGIIIHANKSSMGSETIKMILSDFGMQNASVSIMDDVDENEFIANIAKKAFYINAIVILNKIDLKKNYDQIGREIAKKYGIKVVPVSTVEKTNTEALKRELYENLNLINVYLRPKGTDELNPLIAKKGVTVGEIAKKIHSDVFNDLRCAYVTGKSAKFANQRVGTDHKLDNGDIVTFIKE